MNYFLHQISEGFLLNQNKRSTKSGIIFNSELSVDTWKKATENVNDILISIIKTY